MNSTPMNAESIRILRQRLGHTQVSFAELLGVTPQTVANWEVSRTNPQGPTHRLLRLLDTLQPAAKAIAGPGPTEEAAAKTKKPRRAP